MQHINKAKYDSLVQSVYMLLMSGDNIGMGEMGEAREAAANLVDGWMKENGVKLQETVNLCFYPQYVDFKWSHVEYKPVAIIDKKGEEETIEVVEIGTEDFWSVYLRKVEGGADCVADVPTKELAEKLADLIENLSKKFTPSN